MKLSKYNAVCEICKRQFGHDDENTLKRIVGFHKRSAHGIIGASNTPMARRIAARESYWRKQGYSPDRIAELREKYLAQEQSPAHTADEPVRKTKKATDAVPLALTECPLCHARFYYTQEQKGQ